MARALAIALALVVTAPLPAQAAAPSDPLAAMLAEIVGAFPGNAGVVIADPRSAFRFTWQADRVVPAASLYKLGVMVEAYRQAVAGLISLDSTTVDISDTDTAEDGYFTPEGTTLTVRDAIERMITISDNSPARALLRLLDAHRVNKTVAAIGLHDTRINHGLPPEEQTAPYNTTTALDMERLFLGMYRGLVVSTAASGEMLAVLQRQRIADRLPAGVPEGTVIAHKTGDLDGVAHDAGLIYTPTGPRVAVVLTTDFRSYDDVIDLNEELAALTYARQLDAFAARYAVLSEPSQPIAGRPLSWTVRVENPSEIAWEADVFLRVRLQPATASVTETIGRPTLPPLAPRASSVVTVSLPGLRPGIYLLLLDVYDEDLGTSGNRLPIVFEVRP